MGADLHSPSMCSASLPDMSRAEGAWCDRLCLVYFAAIHEHSNLPLPRARAQARVHGVIAHAAARARADASFVLGIGCMTAFRGPKQVDIARRTLQRLEVTRVVLKEFVWINAATWALMATSFAVCERGPKLGRRGDSLTSSV